MGKSNAYWEGHSAYVDLKSDGDNPYEDCDSDEHLDWNDGWNEAAEEDFASADEDEDDEG